MNSIANFILCLSFLCLGLLRLQTLNTYLSQQELLQLAHTTSPITSNVSIESLNEKLLLIESFRTPATSTPELVLLMLDLYNQRASLEPDSERKSLLYCKGLTVLEQALEQTPNDARLLVHWANLAQILGDFPCELADSPVKKSTARPGSKFQSALEFAHALDATNPFVLSASATLYSWAKQPKAARRYFHRFLELTPKINDFQESQIISLLTDQESVASLIPARFPQALYWSQVLKQRAPERFASLGEGIEGLQLNAISTLSIQNITEASDREFLQAQLLGLLEVSASDRVRREIDHSIHQLFEKQQDIAEYFKNRSNLQELMHVSGIVISDTKPLQSSLAEWGSHDSKFIDEFYNSIGLVLAPGSRPKLLQLRSFFSDFHPAALDSFELYQSEDNRNWRPLEAKVSRISLPGYYLVSFEINQSTGRFLKLHFANGRHDRTLGGPIQNILHVYG